MEENERNGNTHPWSWITLLIYSWGNLRLNSINDFPESKELKLEPQETSVSMFFSLYHPTNNFYFWWLCKAWGNEKVTII